MVQQVVSINRRKYAVGLFWQPVAVGVSGRNYARQLTRIVDRKLNLFTEYRAMIGLGSRRLGHRPGMSSLATEVMEAFAEYSSFLAAFKTGDTFWVIAVRNGIILQDKLFDNEDAARTEYSKLSGMPDWGAMFAPSAWNMPRAVERRVEEVVTGNVKATIKTISRFKGNLLSATLIIVFLVGLVYFFRVPIMHMLAPPSQIAKIDPVLAEQYKKRIEEKNKELDEKYEIKRAAVPQPLAMPYDMLPNAGERAQLCYQAIGFLMQQVPGWLQTGVECGDTLVSVDFKRSFGSLGDFYEYAPNVMPGVLVEERGESALHVSAKLPTLKTSSSLEEKDTDTIVREINTAFQKIDTPVDVNVTVDTIGDDMHSVNVNVVEVGASSKLVPTEFMKIFGDLHGVYMTLAAWDVRTRTWNYEVIIYAK